MSLLLDLIYTVGLLLASPWIVYRLFRTRGWHSVAARFALGLPRVGGQTIWLHGSSVGEVTLLKPLVDLIAKEYPQLKLLITSYTNTGLAVARDEYSSHLVYPFPLDFSFVIDRFLQRLRPRAIVIVESDFWPNFLLRAKQQGIPVCVVNGKLSEKSARIHSRMHIVAPLLGQCECIATQTDEHAQRFKDLGVAAERVQITGNMKYDLARGDAEADASLRSTLSFDDEVVIIGASLHEREDVALLDAFAAIKPDYPRAALVIVPRYPEASPAVLGHVSAAGFASVRKTEIDSGRAPAPGRDGVLVVDTVGDLRRLYAAADIAFVGGSLYFRGTNKGGHNLMEPSILGLPVLFGPYNFSFKETAADLTAADGGRLVHDSTELETALRELLDSPTTRSEVGQRARQVILDGQGATARNMRLLRPLLDARTAVAGAVGTEDNAASGHSLRNS